jgi:hypothetical protein
MSAKGGKPLLEVECCDSAFDKNLTPSKVCWWWSGSRMVSRREEEWEVGMRVKKG